MRSDQKENAARSAPSSSNSTFRQGLALVRTATQEFGEEFTATISFLNASRGFTRRMCALNGHLNPLLSSL